MSLSTIACALYSLFCAFYAVRIYNQGSVLFVFFVGFAIYGGVLAVSNFRMDREDRRWRA